MDKRLKAQLTEDELALCATVGESGDPAEEKVAKLFSTLLDPLFSESDVKELLGGDVSLREVSNAMSALVEQGLLEVTTDTQRPLDTDSDLKLYRKKIDEVKRLKLLAIESRLSDESRRYEFTCDGRVIRSIAKVDRLDAISGEGQQRKEIKRHVEKIATGIESGSQIPNAVLLTINEDTCAVDPEDGEEAPESFVIIKGISDYVEMPNPFALENPVQAMRTVEISFPFRPAAFDEEKAALLVDGQQRTAAMSMVDVEKFPVIALSAIAIVTNADEAKTIFQIANDTQKITTQFSRALIASMEETPGYLRAERVTAVACRRLAIDDKNSPFYGLVRYPNLPSQPQQVVVYNSLFQVVTTFAESGLPVDHDDYVLASTVKKTFEVVKKVWKEAWGKKPTHSRLMHGAGLRALSGLCVELLARLYREHKSLDVKEVWDSLEQSLMRLRSVILWDESAMQGNKSQVKNFRDEISKRQNTSQDISDLTKFLKKESLHLDVEADQKSS